VTPEQTVGQTRAPAEPPSTAGMTTKVVKGSAWTLAGQIVPLGATLVTTPFVIRLLGSESYGVLILVGLIPNYFTFADFGMGMASTKFASEAYGRGEREGESAVIRTASTIAFFSSLCIALPLILLAQPIVTALNVSPNLIAQASLALRLTSVSFVAATLSNVFNTPQLSRLRMDLNAAINTAGRVLLAIGTVGVLWLGGGIVGAAALGLAIALLVLLLHILVSSRLVGQGFGIGLSQELLGPMLRFGGGLLISGIASILLVNFEKLLLSRLVSVRALAYYSVAFTFANMSTMLSWAMVQSLIPAFSQLLTPEKREQFQALYSRCIRMSIILLLPTLTVLFVIARPFFTIWAGPDFGAESTTPFYVLLVGLLFSVIATVPYAALVASGHTHIFAKVQWIEFVPYGILAIFLISKYGILGAAIAWSLRVAVDVLIMMWFARKLLEFSFKTVDYRYLFIFGLLLLLPSFFVAIYYDSYLIILALVLMASIGLYAVTIWKRFVSIEERAWIRGQLRNLVR
jgi:O-antigen/teichoic acid export membrane protein